MNLRIVFRSFTLSIKIQIEKTAMGPKESFPFYGVFYDASTYGEKGKVLNLNHLTFPEIFLQSMQILNANYSNQTYQYSLLHYFSVKFSQWD